MWYFKGKEFTSEDIKTAESFVYVITELSTGKKYIGQKSFIAKKYKQTKGVKKALRGESDWQTYYSSSDYINKQVADGNKDNYKREILFICGLRKVTKSATSVTKGITNYLEALLQMDLRVLENRDKFMNGIINLRTNHVQVNLDKILDYDYNKLNSLYKDSGKTFNDTYKV